MANALSTWVSEMHRRKVFRVTAAYAVVAFVLLQVGEITFEPLQLPEWSLRALILVVVLAFPVVVVLAWVLELTPEGLRKEQPGQGSRYSSVLLVAAVLLLDGALAGYLYQVYAPGVMRDVESVDSNLSRNQDPGRASRVPTTRAGSGADTNPRTTTDLPLNPNALALLPFEDLSPQGDQGYFAVGVSEELADALANVDGLRVISGRAARAFASQNRTPQQIGGLLGVGWLVSGSVRKDGETLRVRVSLTATEDGFDRWSKQFEGDLENTLSIQDEIAQEVVTEVLGSTDAMADVADTRSTIASFDAWNEYLGARADWKLRTPESLASAELKFKATIAEDPTYPDSYAGLADTYLLQASYGNRTVLEAIGLAEQNVDVALKLDGELASAWATLGLLNRMLGRFPQAENHLKRALKLDPENIDAANWLAGMLGALGRLEEERLVLTEAISFNPLDPLINIAMADNELRRGDFDAGLERLERQRNINPDSSMLLRTLASWDVANGRHTNAHKHLLQALLLSPDEPVTQVMMGHLLLRWGEIQRAEEFVARARTMAPENQEVEQAWTRLLMVAGRTDQLEQYAQGRLETLAPQEQGSTADTLLPLIWQGIAALSRGAADESYARFQSVVRRLDILPPHMALEVLSWSAVAGLEAGEASAATEQLDQANRLLQRLKLQGNQSPELNYLEAALLALGGRLEGALTLLENTLPNGWISAQETAADPRLAALRGNPRFETLIGAIADQSRTDLASVAQRLAAITR